MVVGESPLKDLYRTHFPVSPYAVLCKPSHGLRILGKGHDDGGFSPKAAYIFRKQLEEADAIVINRIDELPAATVRVVRAGERAEEQLVRSDAERERDAEVPVVEPRGVVSDAHRRRAGDLRDLVAACREDEPGAALSGQDPEPLVDRACDERDVVDAAEQSGFDDERIFPKPPTHRRRRAAGWSQKKLLRFAVSRRVCSRRIVRLAILRTPSTRRRTSCREPIHVYSSDFNRVR